MIGRIIVSACVTFVVVACAGAAELSVGPGKDFARIGQAMAKAQPGDTILVFPQPDNKPYDKPALFVTKPRLTFRSAAPAGQRIRLNGEGFDYSGRGSTPRAIFHFEPTAHGCTVEGFELYNARNGHNGSGVRINQANDVTIRNCEIHHNDMGIMSNGDGTLKTAVNQLIESCLIHSNGNFNDPGLNHNNYVGGTSIRFVACEIHSSLTGHNLKSRAHNTFVLACYIHDSANREFDLVDSDHTTFPESHAAIVGCTIVKNPRCTGNKAVIHFGQDGGREHDGTLYLAHNTIVTPFISPVIDLSAPKTRTQLFNNIIWDGGTRQPGQQLVNARKPANEKQTVTGQSNWLSSGFDTPALATFGLEQTHLAKPAVNPPFADPSRRDFRLAQPDPSLTDAGVPLPPELTKLIGGPILEHRQPLQSIPRVMKDKPDLGALERSNP